MTKPRKASRKRKRGGSVLKTMLENFTTNKIALAIGGVELTAIRLGSPEEEPLRFELENGGTVTVRGKGTDKPTDNYRVTVSWETPSPFLTTSLAYLLDTMETKFPGTTGWTVLGDD